MKDPKKKDPKKGGRPTKLTEALYRKASTYISTCVDTETMEISEEVTTIGDGVTTTVKKKPRLTVSIPTIEGFALYLRVNVDTIREWKNTDTRFSVIVKDVLAEQARRLLQKGLDGTYNPMIAKLLLSKHGYTEKTETDITSKGESISQKASDQFSKLLQNAQNDPE